MELDEFEKYIVGVGDAIKKGQNPRLVKQPRQQSDGSKTVA